MVIPRAASTTTTILLLFLTLCTSAASSSRLLSTQYEAKATSFLSGESLGVVDVSTLEAVGDNPAAVKNAAAAAAHDILMELKGFTGEEVILPTDHKIGIDEQGNMHVRFKQFWKGLPMEGASIVIHFSAKTGNVFALNGECHSASSIELDTPPEDEMNCEAAVEIALQEYSVGSNGTWESECEAAAVQGRDGLPYVAFKRLRGYQPQGGAPYQRDLIFASPTTGALLAVHPQVYGALSLTTYDCRNGNGSVCYFVSNSTTFISTSDVVANAAHNYAIGTYNFYKDYFNRDSLDDEGITLKSFVHFEVDYNNAAYLHPARMVYGDGDGLLFTYWCRGFDVVVHEFSHGVTRFSSNLVYQDESGALNEAYSDIMGATAERLIQRKSIAKVWLVGEDVALDWFGFDEAIRNMANPWDYDCPDHYADRWRDRDEDKGGVHINSGIINKAFVLMVQGGKHWKTGIAVPALNSDFDTSILEAAQLFYNMNINCLTESSDFVAARECSLLFASASQKTTVAKAWDAVGVKETLSLSNGVKVNGLVLPFYGEVLFFRLNEIVPAGETVTCTVEGSDGTFFLKVRFGSLPDMDPNFIGSDCYSYRQGSKGQCTTGAATAATAVYIAVEALDSDASNVNLECYIGTKPTPPPTLPPTPSPTPCRSQRAVCLSKSQCCGTLTCDGPSRNTKTCKTCKNFKQTCTRVSECCAGLKCKKVKNKNKKQCT